VQPLSQCSVLQAQPGLGSLRVQQTSLSGNRHHMRGATAGQLQGIENCGKHGLILVRVRSTATE
jgi:hypothetical protein